VTEASDAWRAYVVSGIGFLGGGVILNGSLGERASSGSTAAMTSQEMAVTLASSESRITIMWNMGRAGSVLSETSSSEFQHRVTLR
jgi:uncharacterized membrane protein YhiD involved in acid resistance